MGATPKSSIDRWIFHFGINAGQHMDYIGFLKHIKAIGKYWKITQTSLGNCQFIDTHF